MMNPTPLCIYHHGCTDGFAAAWVVRQFFGDGHVDFHPGIYGEAPPDVTGRQVILVDFSYKRDIMLAIIEQAQSVLILDHHETTAADLKDLPAKARVHFDMTRSGAMIAWNHFFPGIGAPLLIDYVQDRDLWQFKFPSTREVTAALFSYPFEFVVWDVLMKSGVPGLINEGLAINRKHKADVAALVKGASRQVTFGELTIKIANVPWMYASDVGHELSKGEPFAGTYYDDENGRRWSLRSHPDGANVAEIAEAFGGGGHRHAAGFRMTREQAIEFDIMGGV
jgi:oligoribonuclease NrnB/cAMP/cGMP phosphodiesterase (DHH superfamily)